MVALSEPEPSDALYKNFLELCYSCRIGDVENADRLISTGVNLNEVDEFDNSPLFLASLCGHEGVVSLLLQRGAVCDRDRYEGARCIYGALTDSIRNILLKYDISKAVDIKQPFASHLSFIFLDGSLNTFDFVFTFEDNVEVRVHRFMLASRSSYFNDKLGTIWKGKRQVRMPVASSASAFSVIIKLIYLVPILHELKPDDLVFIEKFCSKIGFTEVISCLDKMKHTADPSHKSALLNEFQYKLNLNAREQLKQFVHQEIFARKILIEEHFPFEHLSNMTGKSPYCDIFLRIQTENGETYLYMCHKSILIRSDFFRLMFLSSFQESNSDIPIIIDLPATNLKVAEIILSYLYFDLTEIPWEVAIDVLITSDFILADRLKTMAAVTITQSKPFLSNYSIFDVLQVAWDTGVERLEHYAARVIANNIERYICEPEFKEAILKSSKRIKSRQDTDTIELVDDVRFYMLQKHDLQPDILELIDSENDMEFLKSSGLLSYRKDIELLDQLLEELGFDV